MGPLAQFKQQVFRFEAGGGDLVPVANMWLDFALELLRKRVSWVWVVTAGDKAAP